jgi:hypothetical protein
MTYVVSGFKRLKITNFYPLYLRKEIQCDFNCFFCKNHESMGVQKLRKELHDYINNADEIFLKMVYYMSKEL